MNRFIATSKLLLRRGGPSTFSKGYRRATHRWESSSAQPPRPSGPSNLRLFIVGSLTIGLVSAALAAPYVYPERPEAPHPRWQDGGRHLLRKPHYANKTSMLKVSSQPILPEERPYDMHVLNLQRL